MKTKILAFSLLAAVVFSGCASHPVPVTETTEIQTQNTTEATLIPAMTTEPTEITEPTETTPSIDVPAGSHQRRFLCDDTGDYLDYYLFVPQNAVVDMPLIVFLHGDGEVGNIDALESYGPILNIREFYGENFPFIMISPCTRQRSWVNGTIPETLMALIDSIVDECDIDSQRIMITGHSRGAMGVWYLLSEYSDFFCAAVPVSCGSDLPLNYENVSKVPVYALAGDVGTYENMYRNAMEKLVSTLNEQYNGTAYFELLEGFGHEHTSTVAYSREVIEWMLEQ